MAPTENDSKAAGAPSALNVGLEDLAEEEALRRYASGEKPTFSTGICESLTCGYGKLSEYGYWEFPLYLQRKTICLLTPT